MKKLHLFKTVLLLCALIVGSSSVWADSKPWSGDDPATTLDLATITSSTMGTWNGATSWFLSDDYLVVSGYESYKSVSNQTWITYAGVSNSGSSWDELDPFKGSSYYTNANYATIQSGRYLLYKVTNMKSFKVYGKNNATSKYLDIFVYTKSGSDYTKVEEIKYTDDKNNHVWENSETLDPAETYFVYITGVGGSNSRVFEVAFERNVTVTKHTLSSAVLPVSSGTVTLGATSVGEGSTTTISATPNDGYRFVNWTYTGTGASVTNVNAASTTFTMGTSDATVTANFVAIPTHTLSSSVSPAGAGTVTFGSSTVREGATTSATASANSGYKFTGWSITGTGATLSSTSTNPTTVTMGTADATVTATFEAVTTHAISYSVNGVIIDTQNVEEDAAVSFPASISGIPAGYTLMGWSETEVNTPQDDAPSMVSSATSTADKTYYAVMAIASGGGSSDTYALVSNVNNLSDGDKIILVSTGSYKSSGTTYYFTVANGEVNKDKLMDPVDVTIEENTVTSTDVAPITLVAVTGGWKLQMGTQYLNIVSTKNNIVLDDDGAVNTISITNNEATIGGITDGSDTRNIYYNPNSGNGRFAYYKNTQKAISIYKQEAGATYNGYCTTVPTISVTVTSAKYATFSDNVARDFSESGITVYTALAGTNKVTLTEVEDGIVPANTGVVLYSASAVTKSIPAVATEKTELEDNEMVANVARTQIAADGGEGKTNYILANEDSGLGFYLASESGAYLNANRAYLSTATAGKAREFLGFDDEGETTGIANANVNLNANENYYNLNGQRVAQPTKGLYIVNGKKYIVK